MEYGQHIMEAKLMKDDDYIVACKGRKEEANFWLSKSNKYADPIRGHGQNCSLFKTMSYETRTRNRERQLQRRPPGKRARYNAPTEEMSNNK